MDKCEVTTLLKRNKLKKTEQRELLLQIIINSETLFSAEILYEKVNKNINLVTIYRILNLFIKKNIIREVLVHNKTQYYELACEHHPVHPHFLCKKCGKLYCLRSIDKVEFSNLINLYKDYLIEDISLHLSGICPECR
ncbi:MAG TPA: Fur family transcriptional regulator [Spirochaetota bacterium]|nr:Fur family transcriptional regulator [Spirochaetota bacterium]